jgi:hypothetical protein
MFGGASDKSSPRKARAGSLGGGGDLSKETGIHLEQCFYRRDAAFKQGMDKTGGWRYHNHVLQGRYLRFMTHPIKRKRNVASLRLVLVSGKPLGRMKGLRIHPKSEISVATLSMFSAPEGHLYLINVSGLSPSGVEETWQLAFPTEDLQRHWAEQCMHARDLYDLEETNGDAERLRTLVCVYATFYRCPYVHHHAAQYAIH